MSNKVLLVDDDANLLAGLKRHFRKEYDLITAVGGEEAIKYIGQGEEIAVIVSDMRMPGLSGLETLNHFKKHSPNTVRIMLTGNADQKTATDAVNEGEIFRFFNKPCDPASLQIGINAALKQYHLITAERELLENTLAGTIKFLVDLLAFSKPAAFARATRVREWARVCAKVMNLEHRWRIDFAAMMLPLSDMIVDNGLREKFERGEFLSPIEKETLNAAPQVIKGMLSSIPRISEVADIVAATKELSRKEIQSYSLETKILIILDDLAKVTSDVEVKPENFTKMAANIIRYDGDVLKKVQEILLGAQSIYVDQYDKVELPVAAIKPGYTLVNDLSTDDGRLLLSGGTILSKAHVEKIFGMLHNHTIKGNIQVMRPRKILKHPA